MKIQTCFPEFLNVATNVSLISFLTNKNQINFYKIVFMRIFGLNFKELFPAFAFIFFGFHPSNPKKDIGSIWARYQINE